MSDTTTVQSPTTLTRLVCARCGTAGYLPADGAGDEADRMSRAGWQWGQNGETLCGLCVALGKETRQEAAAAYDAETVSRLWDLGSRLRRAGQLDPVAVELVEHAWAALDWVLNHPGQQVHGLPTGQLSSLQDRGEAL